MQTKYMTIYGKVESGEMFRPSDWAERLTYCNDPRVWQKYVFISHCHGVKSLVIDNKMSEHCPEKYKHLLLFAKLHHLVVVLHDKPKLPCLC